MKNITKQWGVIYKDKLIVAIKTPENTVYPGVGFLVYECDTQDELDQFINDNELDKEQMLS